MKKNFIIIGGLPRSGSTLLQRTLITHSKITGGEEFRNLDKIINLKEELINNPVSSNILGKTNIKIAFKKFLSSLFIENEKFKDFQYFSEKTPENIFIIENFIEIFPEAKYILTYRNIYDIILSLKNVRKRSKKKTRRKVTGNIVANSFYMLKFFNKIEELKHKFNDKILLVSYEDFVSNPKQEILRLCKYLEIDFEEEMLTPRKLTLIKKDTPWKTKYDEMNKIIKKNNDTKLSKIELAIINEIFKDNEFVKPYLITNKKNFHRLLTKFIIFLNIFIDKFKTYLYLFMRYKLNLIKPPVYD